MIQHRPLRERRVMKRCAVPYGNNGNSRVQRRFTFSRIGSLRTLKDDIKSNPETFHLKYYSIIPSSRICAARAEFLHHLRRSAQQLKTVFPFFSSCVRRLRPKRCEYLRVISMWTPQEMKYLSNKEWIDVNLSINALWSGSIRDLVLFISTVSLVQLNLKYWPL